MSTPISLFPSRPLLLTAALCALSLSQSQGATSTWTGSSGINANWTTGANWTTPLAAANNIVFAGTTGLTNVNDFTAGSSFNGITYLAGSGAFVLNGNSIVLTQNVDNQSTSLQTINLDVAFSGNRNLSTTSGDITINGNISGTGNFTKAAAGTLTLSGNNTIVGDFNISAGTVSVSSGASLTGSGTTYLVGGTLLYTGAGETISKALGLKTGTTQTGAISASGNGALILTHDINLTGSKVGTLILNGSSTADNTVSGAITDNLSTGTATSLTKDGPGTWVLTGSNSYTGQTIVNGGKLKLDYGAVGAPTANIASSATTTTIRGGGTLEIDGAAGAANVQNFNGLTLGGSVTNKGGGILTVKSGAGGTVAVNLGSLAFNNGSSLDVQATSGVAITTTSTMLAGQTIYQTRTIWNDSDWVTSVGTGTLTMGAFGTLAGSYSALSAAGTDTNNSLLTASATLTNNATTNTLKLAPTASGTLDSAGHALTLSSSGLLFNGSNDFSISNGSIKGASNTELNVWVYGPGVLTINSVVAIAGTSNGLTKAGTGTLVLTGNNTYGGITYLNGGGLSISSNVNLAGSGTAALVISTGTLRATSTFSLANGGTNRGVQIHSGGAAFDVTTGNTMTIGGSVVDGSASSIGSLTKIGGGTLALTGSNSHTGGAFVNEGTLLVNGSMAAAEATTVNSGGTLAGSGVLNGSVTVASGGVVTPGNGVGVLSSGNFSLLSGGTLSMEITGPTAGTGYDQLNVTGVISLAGNLSVSLSSTPTVNDLYFLVLNDGTDAIAGTFAGLAQGATFSTGGQNFLISYTGDATGSTFTGGNDVVLMAVSVPEPATWALAAGGLGAVLFLRRRKTVA